MTAVKYRVIRHLEMRATRGSEEKATTLTKVEKAGGRKGVVEGLKTRGKNDECNEKRKRKARGNGATC